MSRFSALLDVDGPFGEFATTLLAAELPRLPVESRADTVAFVCRRAQQIPGPLRAGVTSLVASAAAAARVVGWPTVTARLRATSLPLLGELARLVRSLGFAYVWETWPNTEPDGSPGPSAGSDRSGTADTDVTDDSDRAPVSTR